MSELFDENVAAEYAHHRGYVDERFVDELASLLVAGRVLDVGAGVGAPARALERRGFDVAAVEPSSAMISEAVKTGGPRHVVRGVGEALPFRDDVFGSAVILYVLHHADEPVCVLAESARVVRPRGRVVVVSGTWQSRRQDFFRRYFPTLTPELPSAVDIKEWAEEAGLRVGELRTAVHWLFRSRTVDEEYLSLVENQMFSRLRMLNVDEFEDGIERLRGDVGKPIPPPEVTVAVLDRPDES